MLRIGAVPFFFVGGVGPFQGKACLFVLFVVYFLVNSRRVLSCKVVIFSVSAYFVRCLVNCIFLFLGQSATSEVGFTCQMVCDICRRC